MKKNEFDLRKALMGHSLKTRDGRKAMIFGVSLGAAYPLLGVACSVNGIEQLTWDLDGRWSLPLIETHNDLLLD